MSFQTGKDRLKIRAWCEKEVPTIAGAVFEDGISEKASRDVRLKL
jgi:hypothetical protein